MKKAIPLFIALIIILCAAFAISAFAEVNTVRTAADAPASAPRAAGYPEITSISADNSGVTITWNRFAGAESYRLFIKGSDGWEPIDDTSSLSYLYEDAPVGVESAYTVRAMDDYGEYISDYSTAGWTHKYLEAPELLSLENTEKGQKLTWKKVSGADMYRIYVMKGAAWVKLTDTAASSYSFTGLTNNTAYGYTVRCVSSDGNVFCSGFDPHGLITRYYDAPAITSVESVKDGSKITWRRVGGATRYRVFIKAAVGWRVAGDAEGSSLIYKNAAQGRTYTYTVRAIDEEGSYLSAYSTKGYTAKFQTMPLMTNVAPGKNGVILCWSEYGGAKTYRVFRRILGGKWQNIADVTGAMYTDTAAPKDQPCAYTVRSLDSSGKYASDYVSSDRYYINGVFVQGDVKIGGYKCTFDRGAVKKGYVTAEDILKIAKAELGTKAHDSMICKYNTWYYGEEVSGDCYAWCVVFFEWVFEQAGARELLYDKTNGAEYFAQGFYNNGTLVKSGYQFGDLLLLHWSEGESSYVPGVQLCNHVAFLISVNDDGTYTTIEGNTGDDPNGEVMIKTRRPDQVSCAGRPKYGFYIPAD